MTEEVKQAELKECQMCHQMLPKEKFDWIDYLSIHKEDFFTLKECKKYSMEYLEQNPKLKKYYLLEPSKITRTLSEINNKFPFPYSL